MKRKPLTRDELRLLDKCTELAKKADFALRSCWECNPAHEHLKQADHLICCFECGRYWYKGVCITDLAIRKEKYGVSQENTK